MYTLSKHKKLGVKGFKTFVKNLELFPEDTVREMTQVGLLEDPVYMKWALENKVEFTVFIDLDYEYTLEVLERLKPKGLNTFIFALKNSTWESDFVEQKLHPRVQTEYWDQVEYTQVTKRQQDQARVRILEIVFEMEKEGEIPSFNWNIPPTEILEGDNIKIDEEGNYKMFYTDGKLALEGKLLNKLREGFWKHYYPNGVMMAEGIYIQGEKEDVWKFFYPDGRDRSEGHFKNSLKNGKWIETGKDGKTMEVTFKNGNPI
ncbi:MAG: hypothetical protein KC493_16875 [Bacteriovoracaceae bacterium]|nr:hypothetical protein [Bacteriovoracaceae bacterium]